MDPRPWTLRELVAMSNARQKEAWTRTGTLLALLEVVNSDGKKRVRFSPAKWNPFLTAEERREKPRGTPITKGNIGMLKMFVPKAKRKKKRKPKG
jgi:hypothetical protein